ncbi:uncharacterized protein LOC135154930 [Lytechinus pictus]|uniref:uncharacterized protein LOC135154930 n=1 Tax=Lytechinus pictus TaxID=7653 RepID=UPI0030B9CCEC
MTSTALSVYPIYAQASVFEKCLLHVGTTGDPNGNSRLYYMYNSTILGYTDTLNSGNRTMIGNLPFEEGEVRTDMEKYGSTLFLIRNKLVEYDTMSKSVKIHDNITVSLKTGVKHTFSPQSIRITGID